MKEKMFLRTYCLIGFDNIKDIIKDLSYIAEPKANYVNGSNVIISTFQSALHIMEIEEFLSMNERDFIIFEMLPGTFSANLNNMEFQNVLFGGRIDNSFNKSMMDMAPGIKDFIKTIKEELETDGGLSEFLPKEEYVESLPDIDELLDKINKVGLENLSSQEKQLLNNYSNNKK